MAGRLYKMKYEKGYSFIGDTLTLSKVVDIGRGYYIFTLNKELPVGFLIESKTLGYRYKVMQILRRYNGIRMKVKAVKEKKQ